MRQAELVAPQNPYEQGLHPEGFDFQRVGRPLEELAMVVGADALTLALFSDTVERNPKKEAARQAYGEFHGQRAMRSTVQLNYLGDSFQEPLDARAFSAWHTGEAYSTETDLLVD